MFGYIKTDIPNMYVKDTVLYKACYCGLCKSIGFVCGQRARFSLTYDLTFLSVYLHNVLDNDIKIEKQHCVIHPLKKRPIAVIDELTKKVGALNVVLAYYKVKDDIIDEKKGNAKILFLRKAYKKAKKYQPKLDEIVKKYFEKLIKLEKENCNSIDIISDPFGSMMVQIFNYFLGVKSNENTNKLAYSIGKWIYLIDAIDDYDKDKKKKEFNVFVNYFNCESKKELLTKFSSEISQIFGLVLSDIRESGLNIEYKFNHDLIDNILYNGLPNQTKLVMECKKCRKKTTKF